MVCFEKAGEQDAVLLKDVQMRAFLSQVPLDMPDLGGPDGYDSAEWQIEMMHKVPYIKILHDDILIGGIVLEPESADHCHVNRIFLDPPFHGKGIGTQAFAWLEKTYPEFRLWTLRTPAFHIRNQRFYERLGYQRVGELEVFPGFVLVEYEKRML